MKALLLSFIVLLSTASLSSQTILKPLPLSSYSYDGHTINFDDTTVWAPRVQKHFMLGWQWAGPNANTNKRLHCNFFQHAYGFNSNMRDYFAHIPDSGGVKYIVWQHISRRGGCYNRPSILTAETYCASIVSVITTKQTFDLSEVVNSMGCTLLQTFDLSEVLVFAVRSVVSTDRQPIPMKRQFGIFSASVYSVSNCRQV